MSRLAISLPHHSGAARESRRAHQNQSIILQMLAQSCTDTFRISIRLQDTIEVQSTNKHFLRTQELTQTLDQTQM